MAAIQYPEGSEAVFSAPMHMQYVETMPVPSAPPADILIYGQQQKIEVVSGIIDPEEFLRQWPLGSCDCCAYRDHNNKCKWCPFFIPMGVCGTCCLLGRIRTLYVEEKPCCFDMGPQGCCLCLISTPINIAGPFGGFCWFAWHSAKMRHDVVKQYNIDDSKSTSCCCCNLPTCCIGLAFPCNLFQVLMTQQDFNHNDIHPVN